MTKRTPDPNRPSGTLYVVATPLGNLADLSDRARTVLAGVTCIACEDTRRTARLLARFGLDTPTVSYHKFNEASRLEPVISRLERGDDVALVSDGGTPGISDPGTMLVSAAQSRGLRVAPVPGPSAVVALLSSSGLPADRFVFDGFLPHRGAERRTRLRLLVAERRTVVVQDSPRRILRTLEDISAIFGDRTLVLGRELTKIHETIVRGTADEIRERLGAGEVRGEIIVAIEGGTGDLQVTGRDRQDTRDLVESWRAALEAGAGDRRAALRTMARSRGMKRAELYRRLVEAGLIDV